MKLKQKWIIKMSQTKEYKADEIFKDIEGDPNNVNMVIPPEV